MYQRDEFHFFIQPLDIYWHVFVYVYFLSHENALYLNIVIVNINGSYRDIHEATCNENKSNCTEDNLVIYFHKALSSALFLFILLHSYNNL
ncbi:MAG: hypothetical protein ACD_3C00207G0001 [uncultured bacterium (gcode 4)]|uniref:Uncharacterized protein n=1 Tax=uncultured bacterium (gcode 4) TaxID=1234023 RepID=K2F8D7_9BACT|nr:MAG: hypothetical protein ACD_3C00207G0001 [uncultured bacterium (gcode 4)]